jgi:hypothetical protein
MARFGNLQLGKVTSHGDWLITLGQDMDAAKEMKHFNIESQMD